MRLVTAEEMREIDQRAMREFGIPGVVLMENAGLRVVEVILERFWEGRARGRKALVLAGPGNNGGDGLVVARHLFNRGAEVKVFLTAPPDAYGGDAGVNLAAARAFGVPLEVAAGSSPSFRAVLASTDIVVDALFGTGFRGAPAEPVAGLIREVNASGKPVVAVDLPTGLEANTGRVPGECIRARVTVTFGLPKLGLYLEPGRSFAGEVVVGDISLPPALRRPDEGSFFLIGAEMVARLLPPRLPEHHKGSYGHALVLGGFPGYTGAVVLAGSAALRSGAGLVTVGVPASLYPIVASKLTEAMARPLAEGPRGGLSPGALEELAGLLERVSAVAVGPGLGQEPETGEFLRLLLQRLRVPVVLDADALNLLARAPDLLTAPELADRRRLWVLTPHPGEMGRLLGKSPEEVQRDRLEAARASAREWGAVVVLKGAATLVATPAGRTYVNPTGNPGLATGGTGDVLAGLIAGLLAQGLAPEEAACAGVYVHGLAGDRVAAARGMAGMVAGDLLGEIPLVLRDLYILGNQGE